MEPVGDNSCRATPSPPGSSRTENPLVYVKEQLGHHSIQITVDTYGHLIPGANRKAVNALDDPGWDMDTGTHPETSILRAISE